MSHYDAAWRDFRPQPAWSRRNLESPALRHPEPKQAKPAKYRAEPQVLDGQRFDSKAELRRFHELLLLGNVGEISDLELHPTFPLVVNGVRIGHYTADFRYWDVIGCCDVIEDVKSPATRKETAYRLRKRLVEALYPWTITEV